MIANPLPTPKGPEKSMEIRLNSIEDAKSVVQHQQHIAKTFKDGGFDSIEYVMADELKTEIMAIIAGVPNVRKCYKTVGARPGNLLYVLPHFEPATPKPVRVPIITQTPPAINGEDVHGAEVVAAPEGKATTASKRK